MSVVVYKAKDGVLELSTKFTKTSAWLSLDQIAELFECDQSILLNHLSNIFRNKKLNKNSVVTIFKIKNVEGKLCSTEFYNLEAITMLAVYIRSRYFIDFNHWASAKINKTYIAKRNRFIKKLRRAFDALNNEKKSKLSERVDPLTANFIERLTEQIKLNLKEENARIIEKKRRLQ